MKKVLFSFLCCLFFIPHPVYAATTYQYNQILFADNFDSDLHQWTLEQGQSNQWFISNGNLLAQDVGTLKSGRLNSSGPWDNYALEVDINNVNGIDEGIGFRRTDGNNTYEVTLRHGAGPYNTPEIILVKVQNGIYTTLQDTHTFPLKNNQWYHLKIEVFQQHLQVFLDNQNIFDFDDNDPLKTGGISLSYWTGDFGQSQVKFDNVKVTNLSKNIYPVIFIPGIGGSELQNGSEKVWVNTNQILLNNQHFFDLLKLNNDTRTSAVALGINNNLTPFGYGNIDAVFADMGYTKNVNYFVFPYDWRHDAVDQNKKLSELITTILQTTHQPKVNIVAHSFGGLVARGYLTTPEHIGQVNKLIEIGVPHLGTPDSLKNLVYGESLGLNILNMINIGLDGLEVKDVIQNFTSIFELLPSNDYFTSYYQLSPFRKDNHDYNFSELIGWLLNNSFNSNALSFAQSFHLLTDPSNHLNLNPIHIYEIVGTGQPTLGQVSESYYITWPIQLIPKVDQIFINGDGTVPLQSAAINAEQTFYTEQNHQQLMEKGGRAWSIVNTILGTGDPPSTKPTLLEGVQLIADHDTTLQLNDQQKQNPEIKISKVGKSSQLFIKKSAGPQAIKISSSQSKTNLLVRHYQQDKITQSDFYYHLPTNPNTPLSIELNPTTLEPAPIIINNNTYPPIVTAGNQLDQIPPTTTVSTSGNYVTLDTQDFGVGTQEIEFSLDNSQTIYHYTGPFYVESGTHTLQVTSTDKVGNQEIPQTKTISIANPTSPFSPRPSPTSSSFIQLTTFPSPSPFPSVTPFPSSHLLALNTSWIPSFWDTLLADWRIIILFFVLIILISWSMVKP